MLNTVKTSLGFFVAVIEKYTPLSFRGEGLEHTYNFLKISDDLTTSGQPTEQQIRLMKEAGYQTVINLAPRSVLENSLQTERALLASLEMAYIHIPVDFRNPTQGNFDQFVSSMQAHSGDKVWVHCAANARVSAFVYKYRCLVLGENKQVAEVDLKKIWEPWGVWKAFIT